MPSKYMSMDFRTAPGSDKIKDWQGSLSSIADKIALQPLRLLQSIYKLFMNLYIVKMPFIINFWKSNVARADMTKTYIIHHNLRNDHLRLRPNSAVYLKFPVI